MTSSKVLLNALMGEKLLRLDKFERQEIVLELSKDYSERALAEITGINRSTINDWKTLRQSSKGEFVHIGWNNICKKILAINIDEFNDWGRIEQVKEACEQVLSRRIK